MSLEHRNASSGAPDSSLDELHELLEDAELRRDAELSRAGKKVSRIIMISSALLMVWAAVFLMRYHLNEGAAQDKPIIGGRVAEPAAKDKGDYDGFLPDAMRVDKAAKAAPGDGKIVGKEDISFAMEIINFGNSPTTSKKTEERVSESAVKEH